MTRPTWQRTLNDYAPLLLPVAHDPLTARMIENLRFPAFQVGGFGLIGANFALPDVDLVDFGQEFPLIERIVQTVKIPALVDCNNGHGDVKMVTRVVKSYEQAGAAALFIEDQASPKKCGHMSDKKLVTTREQVSKLKAAVHACENSDTFILARSDAYGVEGLDSLIRRCDAYMKAGVDGLYFEGIDNISAIELAAKEFEGVPLAMSILEGGGKTPWTKPSELHDMGYSMILYPTSVLFRVVLAIGRGLTGILDSKPMLATEGVTMAMFEKQVVDLPRWEQIEAIFKK